VHPVGSYCTDTKRA